MYQRAKQQRATDPRYLAMKEVVKERQRAAYQKVKEQRKAVAADAKAKRKAERSEASTSRRARANLELMKLVTWVRSSSAAQND